MAQRQPEEILHWHMVHAHKTFKAGFDSILSHLADPPFHDLSNFLGYCEAWAQSIDGHHDSEEEVVFPFLNRKMDFSGEIGEHKVIHAALDEILAHITAAKADPSKFDAPKLKGMMEAFRTPLYSHLDEEVKHVAPDKVSVFDAKELLEMDAALDKYAKSHGDPFIIVPFMVSHTTPDVKSSWPPMPWMLRKVVIPYMLAMRHSGYWKYAPYALS